MQVVGAQVQEPYIDKDTTGLGVQNDGQRKPKDWTKQDRNHFWASLALMTVIPLLTFSRVSLAVVSLISFVFLHYAVRSRRPRSFPPGPPILPVIGNLHQFPLKKPFIKFHEWSKSYGPIAGIKLGPQNVVVLNNYKAVRDLLENRGAIYSSRPSSYVGNELLCPNDTHILLAPYGSGWRALRKAVQAVLNVTAVDGLLPIQEAEASQTLFELTQTPEKCFTHIRRYSTAVILAAVFGQRGASYEDPKVQALYHAQEQFTEILAPGATPPVDAFPFLKYMPNFLASYKWAAAIRKEQRTLYSSLLDETATRAQRQDKASCFMDKLLEDKYNAGLSREQTLYTGGILMEAGSDTTSSTLHSFILAMITYPEILRKAQKELDEVCGASRSPSSNDSKSLPYVQAMMTETLRWRPVAPGGIPHMLIQDDTYEGYFLPKGTIVFANTWSVHQDEAEYDKPEEFMPERFLEDRFGTKNSGAGRDDNQRRVTYDFGAGRRVCPGQRLSENSLMINMAKLAWAFDIKADPNAPPLDLNVETSYSDGFVFGPKPFSASFNARSAKHLETIEREYEEAKIFFKRYE